MTGTNRSLIRKRINRNTSRAVNVETLDINSSLNRFEETQIPSFFLSILENNRSISIDLEGETVAIDATKIKREKRGEKNRGATRIRAICAAVQTYRTAKILHLVTGF